jgi:hypothetical protein
LVHLVRDRDRSRAVVSMVANILFHKGHRITELSALELGESCRWVQLNWGRQAAVCDAKLPVHADKVSGVVTSLSNSKRPSGK